MASLQNTKSMFTISNMLGKLSLILWLENELSFEGKRQAVTLASRTSVMINNEPVQSGSTAYVPETVL